jgi:hypothetical protein
MNTIFQRATDILKRITFPGYEFIVTAKIGGSTWMQGRYMETCAITGKLEEQKTRKWLLSEHMTDSEVVFTALKLCLTSMEDRTREFFTYRGQRIASPHFDVEDLVKLCRDGRGDAGGRIDNRR